MLALLVVVDRDRRGYQVPFPLLTVVLLASVTALLKDSDCVRVIGPVDVNSANEDSV